ncbi:hypothetical protein CDL12_30483 [Handroanthus impetiginosus]|uniref:RanBD1 domain-containing protein n=1 Tax=Handroanthus impetiginosus TaxID=429701 RepID=A0A2G9FVX5_9LAMI|nr:hypothetical protein CDL12_30483 [Handroanthus impetiginosus]
MGDADDNIQPSKKRAAGVQLSRDDPDLDDNEETSDQETGTFKRASDEVLATRRIVKVRRQQSSTPSAPSPASNPFASIHLVPPASAPTVESDAAGVTTMGSEQVDKNDSKSGNVVDEPNDESTAGAKPSEKKGDEPAKQDKSVIVGEQAESVNGEVAEDGTRKARLIMRARGNYRLILNANLFPDMKLTNMDKKGITFACVNSASEGKDGLSTIALKFKDASIVEEFRAAVMEHKSKTAIALKTPENSP